MKNVFLIGYMGTGKSTVAAYMAKNCGMEILEMDQLIEEGEGMSIADMFANKGEAYFREAETKLLTQISKTEHKVISCGGGVVLREKNVQIMKESGYVILLSASAETIWQRVKDDEKRPLLQGNKTIACIQNMLDKRRPQYEHAADLRIVTDGKCVDEICREIIESLKEWEKCYV